MDLKDILLRIQSDATAALSLLPVTPTGTVVKAGDNLQAALDGGGVITIEDNAVFGGNYVARVAGTTVVGPKAKIAGVAGGPALSIPPGSKNISVTIGIITSDDPQRAVAVGDNDSAKQGTLDSVPDGIELTTFVPTFRGKTAFWINGRNVRLINCGCADVFSAWGSDSQGVAILNTPGPVSVEGGTFEAASENILVGGSGTGIANVVPSGLTFQDLTLIKRASWFTAGKPPVKNSFELKAGLDVTLRRTKIDGNWLGGQPNGSCIVLTPRDGKQVGRVLIEDVTCVNVGAGINMASHDDIAYCPQMTDVTFRRLSVTTDKTRGTGWFALMAGEHQNVVFDSCQFVGQGTTIYAVIGTVWDSPTSKHLGWRSKGVKVLNNRLASNSYGVMLTAVAPGTTDAPAGRGYGANWQWAWPDGVISGNTFAGSTAAMMKKNLPVDNVFTS